MSWRALASLLAGAALLSACGSEDAGSGGGAAPPAAQLQVQFWPMGEEGEVVSAILACDPVGGTHPRAARACAVLAEFPDALQSVPRDVACTEIYGGPETAAVTGTLDGRSIRARFNRTNGCEIARWEKLHPLLRLRD
jgi:hypothetical protein